MSATHILLFPFGSHGDVHPFVGLALALQARGHLVTVVNNGHFRPLIEKAGLPFVEQGTAEEYLRATEHPDLWHPQRSFGYVFRTGISVAMRPQYDLVVDYARRGSVLAITSCLGFGVRIAGEKLGVPVVTIHLQPAVLWSNHEPPTLAGVPDWPRWLKRFAYWAGERFIIDATVLPVVNPFRAEVGLPPMRQTTRWWHSPDLVLGLFPDWFAPPQPDWPANTQLTGFPLWDEAGVTPVNPEIEQFLAEGDPPLVFTPGSSHRLAHEFFVAAADACQRLGRRGMLLSRFREQIPTALPPSIRHFDYVPFGQLLPRAAALVHHGGIGTISQGLRAGVPQLIMPLAHDQPDNAARVKKLGVGDWLKPAHFRGPAVADRLGNLLASPLVREACRRVAAHFDDGNPLAPACTAIEGLMVQRQTVPTT